MPQLKTKCVKCGVEILTTTAERTGGLCMPCKEHRPHRVTLSAQEGEAELEIAASSLEARARMLRVQTKQIASEEWGKLAPHLQDFVPHWYRGILSRFSLYGVALEYRDKPNPFVCGFSFIGPEDYNAMMEQGSLYSPLRIHEFVPIGDDPYGDGNLWLVESPATAASVVHKLVLSEWGGGRPTKGNGFRFAASRLSLLLCSMGISESSYYVSPSGVTSVIWYEDRESDNQA
jgi:hypothetical protein